MLKLYYAQAVPYPCTKTPFSTPHDIRLPL
nr:MAG TPA: hypothetical protein [Caudoviricetes sp.]